MENLVGTGTWLGPTRAEPAERFFSRKGSQLVLQVAKDLIPDELARFEWSSFDIRFLDRSIKDSHRGWIFNGEASKEFQQLENDGLFTLSVGVYTECCRRIGDKEDEDYKVHGFQLGSHGDKSQAMGYGGMTSKETAWGKSISGHVHKSQILRNTFTVGTCLPLNMFYMRGYPSDWTHSHALLWDTGQVQLINIVNRKWRG